MEKHCKNYFNELFQNITLDVMNIKPIKDWFADPEYKEAMKFRHASSEAWILVQEGGADTNDPDPKL